MNEQQKAVDQQWTSTKSALPCHCAAEALPCHCAHHQLRCTASDNVKGKLIHPVTAAPCCTVPLCAAVLVSMHSCCWQLVQHSLASQPALQPSSISCTAKTTLSRLCPHQSPRGPFSSSSASVATSVCLFKLGTMFKEGLRVAMAA